MSDLTADLRTVLDELQVHLLFPEEHDDLARLRAALAAGVRLAMPDAPLAERLTEQERDDLRLLLRKFDAMAEDIGGHPDSPWYRLRTALDPSSPPTDESETNR